MPHLLMSISVNVDAQRTSPGRGSLGTSVSVELVGPNESASFEEVQQALECTGSLIERRNIAHGVAFTFGVGQYEGVSWIAHLC
jgi:hypothetical protein